MNNLDFLIFENNNTVATLIKTTWDYLIESIRLCNGITRITCTRGYRICIRLARLRISQRLLNSWKMSRGSRISMHKDVPWLAIGQKRRQEALARRRVSMRQGDIIKLTMSREPLPSTSSRPLTPAPFSHDANLV